MSAVSFLICDPSPAVQTFLQRQLAGYGFDVGAIKTAGNPQAAAEIAPSLTPDFLITDWFAKEPLSGLDLYRLVVKSSPRCRFALLAQGISATDEREVREAGALFLLPKPFSADSARAELERALEQLAAHHPHISQRLHANQHAVAQPRAATVLMPTLPKFKPGDRVVYRNQTEVVQHVILRRGEMVVQLRDVAGLIESTKIQLR